jgi:hypothetical protein
MPILQTGLLKTLGVGAIVGVAALMGLTVAVGFALVAGLSRRAAASVGTGLVGCAALIAVLILGMWRRKLERRGMGARHPRPLVRGAASTARRPGLA